MNRIWWVVIGVLVLASALLRNELLLLMSLILMLLAGSSYLWARYCLEGVTFQRRFDATRLFFGEETNMYLQIVNAKPLPLTWLRADDEYPSALVPDEHERSRGFGGGRRRLIIALSLRWYERVTRRYTVKGLRRGVWRFGPTQLRSGDIFGFDIRRQTTEKTERVIVYPLVVPVTALGLPARQPFGDFAAYRRLLEDPMRLMGAREYAQGDSFRYIHWKATARRRQLQTKVFEPSTSRPVALFLNVNTSDRYTDGFDWELREFAISAAASIARHVVEEGQTVGLFTNALMPGTLSNVRIQLRQDAEQLIRILEALAYIEGHGNWSIDRLLHAEAVGLPYGATIVVISATVNQRLRQTLVDLRRREFGVALVTLGDRDQNELLPGIQTYHLGGHEEWNALEALELA